MEFNAGIFSFTGTRSNPLNIFPAHELTAPAAKTEAAQAAAMASRSEFSLCNINDLSALTCRQEAFR
jgi:hypothetical protein